MTRLAERLFQEAEAEDCPTTAEWRRERPRRYVYEGIDVTVDGSKEPFQAFAVDVAQDSIGFTCRKRLHTATRVRIRRALGAPHEFCEGIVVNCTPGIQGYRVGVKVLMSRRSSAGEITGASLVVGETL